MRDSLLLQIWPRIPSSFSGPAAVALAGLLLLGCSDRGDGGTGGRGIRFGEMGSLVSAAGRAGFRFGAATAATQIEDRNSSTDWWLFTQPVAEGGLGRGTFVGEASRGYTLALADIELLRAMHLDSYRFSIEWARIEPQRDQIDEDALRHYSDVIDGLVAAGIRPMVTIHHFSNPVWIDDPRDPTCARGPSDANLCGLGHPVGGPLVIDEFEQHARLLAERFGDRVDEWGTFNEPVNYVLAGYGIGSFPPGKVQLFDFERGFMSVVRDLLTAHARMARAIRDADRIDADGDGSPADVGLTLSVAHWVAARDNHPSDDPADLAARDRLVYAFHHLAVDSLRNGTFDPDVDGVPDESHPEWRDTLSWLGVQYYFRGGVTGAVASVPVLNLTPCFGTVDGGACLPPLDPTYCVPQMGYEHWAPGLNEVLADFGGRWPDLPLLVSESGIATDTGARRAENVVRALEQIQRARDSGVDVRGYLHWSFYDNFEWAEGFAPHFGLYSVDRSTFARSATEGAVVFGEIAGARNLTPAQLQKFGGDGPLTPELGAPASPALCTKASLAR